MHHLLGILSPLILATSFFQWPSATYAVPDRCLVPPPHDAYGCEYPRYVFYNNPRGYCDRFVDWSCGRGETGLRNAFETREECEVVCGVRGDRLAAVDITGFVTLSGSPLMAGSRGRDVLLRCSLLEGNLENFTGYATVLLEGEVPGGPSTNFAYGAVMIPSGAQESSTVTTATEEGTQGTDANVPMVPQANEGPTDGGPNEEGPTPEGPTDGGPTNEVPTDETPTDEGPTDDVPTAPSQTDDLPANDADLLEKELQSLLVMNEVITVVSEPTAAVTSAPGEEESPSIGEGNSPGEGSPTGTKENSSGDERSTSGDRGISSGHGGNPSVDEPLVKMHISVELPSQTEGDGDYGNSLVTAPLPTELAEAQNLKVPPQTAKEIAFDYISIGVVALALAMYLVVMGAIVGVAYALRKKKRSNSSDKDTKRDGSWSEMIMIDLT